MEEFKSDIQVRVAGVVCSYFGVPESDLYGRAAYSNVFLARGYAWVLLHDEFGFSGSRIARLYGRKIRAVWHSVAKVRYLSVSQKAYGAIYRTLSDAVRDEADGGLYEVRGIQSQ